MPRLEPKQIQKELEAGKLRPVYCIYGPERMKARELVRRIKSAAQGEEASVTSSLLSCETLDGAETDGAAVVDAARSLSLAGGTRFVVVRDAHALKGAEALGELLGDPPFDARPKAELSGVCVLLAKELDGRRKFSKTLVERAGVVACDEIADVDREAWVGYLAKRRGLALDPAVVTGLRSLDPWSLDRVDQELSKLEAAGGDVDVLVAGAGEAGKSSEVFLEALFRRDKAKALAAAADFSDSPEIALPLLGLLGWYVRNLALLVSRRVSVRDLRLNPFAQERLARWARTWSLADVLKLQRRLQELDFSIKQTPKLGISLWSTLAMG